MPDPKTSPGPRLILEIPTSEFHSEADLANYLLATPLASDAQFLYRGQAREYRRQWPLIDGEFRPVTAEDLMDIQCWRFEPESLKLPIPLLPRTFDLPSLIPTNTRAWEHFLTNPAPGESEDAYDDMMVHFWTFVCFFTVCIACLRKEDAAGLAWLQTQWTTDVPHLHKLRSIGQHYGMETGLLDATSSVPVALWFATHAFQTGAYRPNSTAVLYRIDRSILHAAERWVEALPEHEGEFDAATIDLRDTPDTLAARAIRQQGWSLVGWDHPRLITRIVATGGLTRFTFPTGQGPCAANSLTRDWLVPRHDPVGELFSVFWTEQLHSMAQAQTWIDRYWNVVPGVRIQLDPAGCWKKNLSTQFRPLFDHYSC